MNTTVKNIFGVAAAIIVLLSFNWATNSDTIPLPEYDTKVENAEDRSAASLKDFNDAIVDIAEKTNPSVVTITTKRTQEVRMMDPFSQFFGNPRGQGETQERIQRGLGSGVIVSEKGYILTNNHVIADTDEITVRMLNGNEVNAELVGTDPQTDIAVLKVDVDNLSAIEMGNSDKLKVGSLVLAIGSPLREALAHTVSFGIVSARGRNIGLIQNAQEQWVGYENFIQTDAAINPGNSGGALIDVNGQLVGINSAIASRSGGNDGIGFAIPINLAERIMNDLIDDGEVSRGYLGMYMAGEVDQTMAQALGLDGVRGVIAGRIEEGGPADEAGLQPQDVIVSMDGEQVQNWSAFRTAIASKIPGDQVILGIIRDNEEMQLTVTLGERQSEEIATLSPEQAESMEESLGFSVLDLNSEIRSQLDVSNDVEGVVVSRINESSAAFERGLRQGDLITAVKQKKVTSQSDFYDEIEKAAESGDNVVLLTLIRNDLKQYLAFEL